MCNFNFCKKNKGKNEKNWPSTFSGTSSSSLCFDVFVFFGVIVVTKSSPWNVLWIISKRQNYFAKCEKTITFSFLFLELLMESVQHPLKKFKRITLLVKNKMLFRFRLNGLILCFTNRIMVRMKYLNKFVWRDLCFKVSGAPHFSAQKSKLLAEKSFHLIWKKSEGEYGVIYEKPFRHFEKRGKSLELASYESKIG